MDRATVNVYERNVDEWIEHRHRPRPAALDPFTARVPPGVRADVGCGPGWHSGELGSPVVALDAATAMAAQVRRFAPRAWPVVADLEHLPLRTGALTGAWAHKSYMHIAGESLPLALADLHRSVALGGAVHIRVTSDRRRRDGEDRFPGRHFTRWPPERLRDVVEGAGFVIEDFADDGKEWLDVEAHAGRMLPDTVGADMRVLVVGLNPSLLSADVGTGFARPGNRFWPAALASGLVTRALDPVARAPCRPRRHDQHRAPRDASAPRSSTRAEYVQGTDALAAARPMVAAPRRCASSVSPATGSRVDRHAALGWQEPFAGVPTYVMPNTSGLNAHAKPADFAEHLREVVSAT